jgi:hypothetical protein
LSSRVLLGIRHFDQSRITPRERSSRNQFTLQALRSALSSFSSQHAAPLHPSMDSMSNDPFPWYRAHQMDSWCQRRFEIQDCFNHPIQVGTWQHHIILSNSNAPIAAFVGNKIDAHVGNHPANRFTSHMNVFLRTLWLPQVTMRNTVLLDHPLVAQDVASFRQAIRQFIAVHSTDNVRLELDYPRSIAMPPKRPKVPMYRR